MDAEAERQELWRWYRLEELIESDQAKAVREMIEDEHGYGTMGGPGRSRCILPLEHPHALSLMRVGKIHHVRDGSYSWRCYRWLPEGGGRKHHTEHRTDTEGKGLWEKPLGTGAPWKQLLGVDEFDLTSSDRRAIVVRYHLAH